MAAILYNGIKWDSQHFAREARPGQAVEPAGHWAPPMTIMSFVFLTNSHRFASFNPSFSFSLEVHPKPLAGHLLRHPMWLFKLNWEAASIPVAADERYEPLWPPILKELLVLHKMC